MTGSDQKKTEKRSVPGVVLALAAAGLLFGAWQGVSWGVSVYVDSRIEGKVGAPVVDFVLPDLDGRVWRASDLRGRTVVLHFFRSKCVSCIGERPVIQDLEQRLDPERVVLLGVLLDRVQGYEEETTRKTLATLAYTHPILIADEAFVDAFHGAGWSHVTPITYVVDPEGRITESFRGRLDPQELLSALPEGASGPK